MQPLTGSPRDHLTVSQVTDVLQADQVQVGFGADLLDIDLTYLDDLTDDLAGGQVERDCVRTIHGTCRLELSRELEWGNVLVRPWQTLTAGGVETKWFLGVFSLTTPVRTVGRTPVTFQVQGYDRLSLLDRQVGADYTVTSGTDYRTALLAVFAAAGLSGVYVDGSAADLTLPATRTWTLVPSDESDPDQTDTPVTYLRVVNDLLRAINFRPVWCGPEGTFRCSAYLSPADAPVEYTFDADDPSVSIVGAERTLTEDVWSAPNRWVFRGTNFGTGVEGDGVYTVDESDAVDGDRLGRTLVWTSVVDYEAADQATLVGLGDRRVADDKRLSSRLSLTSGPFPAAGHFDVFQLVDAEVGGRKVQASGWRLPLDGGDVEWEWETV